MTDFRKGHNGLYGIVQTVMQSNPIDGSVYVFFNKRRNQIRLLVYDAGGLVLLSKKLEQGTYEMIKSESDTSKISISWVQLSCIMQGIRLRSIKYRRRLKIVEENL
jgi:transposase